MVAYIWASLEAQAIKNPPAMWETWVQSMGWENLPGEGHGNPLQYSCWENPHEQRSLVGCGLRGCKEFERTEGLRKHSTADTCQCYFLNSLPSLCVHKS